MFDDQTEPQLVPKLLLQVSVRELNNSLISDPSYGGLKDARDEDDNIIIIDSTLRSHQDPLTWDTDHSLVTLVNLRAPIGQRKIEKDWDSTIPEYVKRIFKDTPKTFNMIKEMLSKASEYSGVPPDYFIRTDLSHADGSDNPGTNYTSKDAEMIARAHTLLELGLGDEEIGVVFYF